MTHHGKATTHTSNLQQIRLECGHHLGGVAPAKWIGENEQESLVCGDVNTIAHGINRSLRTTFTNSSSRRASAATTDRPKSVIR